MPSTRRAPRRGTAPRSGAAPRRARPRLGPRADRRGAGLRLPRAPALVRRADGQTIQLTPLLYPVLGQSDGRRSHEEIAEAVGPAVGRQVTAENVRTLCDRLRTLGALKLADGSEPELRRSNPLLALRFRYVVSDPEVTSRLTAPFALLFAPVVVVLVCARVLRRLRVGAARQGAGVGHPPGVRPAGPAARASSPSPSSRRASTSSGTPPPPATGVPRPARWAPASTSCGRRSTPTSPTATGSAGRGGCAPTSAGSTSTPSSRSRCSASGGRPGGTRSCSSSPPRCCRWCASWRRWCASTATTSSPTSPACLTSTTGSSRPCSGLLPGHWNARGHGAQAVGPRRRHRLGARRRAGAARAPSC